LISHKNTEKSPPPAPTESAGSSKSGVSPTSLKNLAMKGSAWTMLDIVMGQALRFGGNIILTRLLAPEAFGMMGIINALLTGLQMFSDVGLRPNIIQNRRGEEPIFLHTAWVIQIIRGILLALIVAVLAWPLAIFYKEPSLVLITSVAGITAFIAGFYSTWLLVLDRRIAQGKLTVLNLISSVLKIGAMILCAWYFPSVWALVLGSFVGGTVRLIASHTIFAGIPMRFQWEPKTVHELIRFGRWMFISTALGFLVTRFDIFIFGNFAGMAMLGFYTLAKNLSRLAIEAVTTFSSRILLPVYSRLAERNIEALRSRTFKIRTILLALFLPPLWVFILWGDHIVAFLYDERYQEAGWMLQILAAGATATAIITSIQPILLAVGDSFRHLLRTIARVFFMIVGMSVGAYMGGIPGFIVGLALTDFLTYPVMVYLIRPYGVWLPKLDAVAFGTSFIVIGIAWWMN